MLLKELTQKEEAMRIQSTAAQSLALQGRVSEQEVASLNARLVELLPLQLQLTQSKQSVQQLASQCRSNELALDRMCRERDRCERRAEEAEQRLQAQRVVEKQLSESLAFIHSLQQQLAALQRDATSHAADVAAHELSVRAANDKFTQMTVDSEQQERELETLRKLTERLQISALAAKQKAQKEEAQGFSQAQLWERVQCLQLRANELDAALRRRERDDKEKAEEGDAEAHARRKGRCGLLTLIPMCGAE